MRARAAPLKQPMRSPIPFGLHSWHLLMPGLTEDLLKSKAVQKLLETYVNASPEGKALIDAMAERESKIKPSAT